MKSRSAYVVAVGSIVLLLLLAACGGGGGGSTPAPPPTRTAVTAGLSGPSLVIGSVDLEITLPAGFILAVDAQGNPTSLALAASASGVTLASNYVHPSLKISLIKATGFFPGDLISFSRALATGESVPASGDFTCTYKAFDLNGTEFAAGSFTTTLRAVGQ